MTADVLWTPADATVSQTYMAQFMRWLREHRGVAADDYETLWRWSVSDLAEFWSAVWDFCEVQGERTEPALAESAMPFARWFPESRVNYAEHLLAHATEEPHRPALVALAEDGPSRTLTWEQIRDQAAGLADWLLEQGVQPGDVVASYLPNIPETVVAFIATAGIGATWTSCAPEFGAPSVVDRFRQVQPKVLLVSDGYQFRGRPVDRRAAARDIRDRLPSVEHVVHVPYPIGLSEETPHGAVEWTEITSRTADWLPRRVPFDHPLWILYSSGTTGLPKAIVHGHGGILLEHLKSHRLHLNLGTDDVFFWYTSTGWVMWNLLTAGLLTGSTLVLYDGDPAHPNAGVLWDMADRLGVTVFGGSASFYSLCLKEGLHPGGDYSLEHLRCIGSTGSPLTTDAFRWIYREVKADVWAMSFSGGTDVATAFVGGCPLLPVREGELQCRWLGVDAQALGDTGQFARGVGELVVSQPMPSMPLRLVNDPSGRRYRESYFSTYPGRWRHGDWVEFTPAGGAVIHGRSDATINRRGIRMGTAELYRAVEKLPEVQDSLAVDLEGLHGASFLLMFVALREGEDLDADLERRLRAAIRNDLSPRHVPDRFVAVPDIPRTLNGKKLEVPVRQLLLGADVTEVASRDALQNPNALRIFNELAEDLRAEGVNLERDSSG